MLKRVLIAATCLSPVGAWGQSPLAVLSPLTTPGAGPITGAAIQAAGKTKVDTVNGSLTTPTIVGPVTAGTGAAIPGVDVSGAMITLPNLSAQTLSSALATVAASATGAIHPLNGTPFIGCPNLNVDGTTIKCTGSGALTAPGGGGGNVSSPVIQSTLAASPIDISAQKAQGALDSTARALSAVFDDTIQGANNGMRCNYQIYGDVTSTANSPVVSIPDGHFTQADVGDTVQGGYNFGGINTTIISVQSATSITLNVNVPTSITSAGTLSIFTDDTAALRATVAAYTSAGPKGADVVLPSGTCVIGGEIDVPASTNLRFRGSGATHLLWDALTNGIVIKESNGANVTVADLTISKLPGTNGSGSNLQETALWVGSLNSLVGENNITNILIYGATGSGQADGWSDGLVEANLARASTTHISVTQPFGVPSSVNGVRTPIAGVPTPSSLGSMPASLGFGVGSDVVEEGINNTYAIDNSFADIVTTGGNEGFEAGAYQGIFGTKLKLEDTHFGLRADGTLSTAGCGITSSFVGTCTNGSGTDELLQLSSSYAIADISDVYTNGSSYLNLAGNTFWSFGAATGAWTAVWSRDQNNDMVTGNGIEGNSIQAGQASLQTGATSGASTLSAANATGVAGGQQIVDATTPGSLPVGEALSSRSYGVPPFTLSLTAPTSAAIPTTDTLVAANAAQIATGGTTTSVTVANGASFLPGAVLIDYTQAGLNTPSAYTRFVKSVSGNVVTPTIPWTTAPAAGDAIISYAGDFGVVFEWDSGGAYPHTAIGNNAANLDGPIVAAGPLNTTAGFGNNTTGVTAIGNVTSIPNNNFIPMVLDAGYVNGGYMGNLFDFNYTLNQGGANVEEDASGNYQYKHGIFIGDPLDAGSFSVYGTGFTPSFTVSQSGAVAVPGTLTAGTSAAAVSSVYTVPGHTTRSFDEQVFSSAGVLTTDGNPASTANLGPLQTGLTRFKGDVTCWNGSTYAVWNFDGLWGGSPYANVAGHFSATSGDNSTIPSGWTLAASALDGATAGQGYPEVTLSGAPAQTDCTARLLETNIQ